MNPTNKNINAKILNEAAKILSQYFNSPTNIISAAYLSGDDRRNAVLRLILDSIGKQVPKSIILKQSLPEKENKDDSNIFGRFARDWAGLQFLSEIANDVPMAPQFFGGSKQYRFVLLEDLGTKHLNLVDSLMGNNRNEAILALHRYMKALGTLHANAYEHTEKYQKILNSVNQNPEEWPCEIADIPNKISKTLEKLGISYDKHLDQEIKYILMQVKQKGIFTTLMHGDICPDNVFDDPINNTMKIIDFEWSYLGNALLDGVYLRMSNPTCWCAKRFPQDIIEPLEDIYRQELIKKIPAAGDDKLYFDAYVSACAYWVVLQLTWKFFEDILCKENDILNSQFKNPHPKWQAKDNRSRPRYLARLQAFIEVSKKHDRLPNLRNMAEQVLMALKRRWPDVEPLELFQPFR